MIQYRYDGLQMSTEIPNFINLGTVTSGLSCSGTIPNGGILNFQTQVNANTFTTFNDVKIYSNLVGIATYLTNDVAIDAIWDYQGIGANAETVQNSVNFIGTLVTVKISVSNNTGSTITLIPQTFNIEVIGYQLPF